MTRSCFTIPFSACLLAVAAALSAAVGDPQIATDHAQMKGELSCSTFERLEATAFTQFQARHGRAPANAVERVIAHWAWRTEHHQHADGDNLIYGKGCKRALSADPEGLGFCRDGLAGLFGFSTGLCYSIHAQFTPFIQRTLGDPLATSCTLVPGHTSFEAFADGAWRIADMTTGTMVFDKNPQNPIGILDVVAAQGRIGELNGGFMKLKLGPFGDPIKTYASVNQPHGDGRQRMFGFLAMPMVYTLRSGETFTRWRLPDGGDGVEAIWSKDYFEQAQAGRFPKHHGMARRETFMTFGPVGNGSIGRKGRVDPLVYSAKGAFEFVPDFANLDLKELNASPTIALKAGKLTASGGDGQFVLTHAAPYPIAAHQADNAAAVWDVIKNPCDKTAVLTLAGTAGVKVALSFDVGQSWEELGGADAPLDFSNKAKGRHSYQLRVTVPDKAEVSAISLRTVVQVGPAVFPYLKDGGSTISYQAGNLGVIHGGPDIRMAKAFRAAELDTPGWTVYRFTTPGQIRSLHGASMSVERKEMSVETSLDGKAWDVVMAPVSLGRGGKEKNSSVWGNGTLGFMWGDKSYPAGTSNLGFIRFKNADETGTQIYATYELPGQSGGLDVAVNWTDAAGPHDSKTTFKAGPGLQTWTIPTGTGTVTNSIQFKPSK